MNKGFKNHIDEEFQKTESKVRLYNEIKEYTSKFLKKK